MSNHEAVRSGGHVGPDRTAGPDREPPFRPLRSGPAHDWQPGKSISPAILRSGLLAVLEELAVRPRVWTAHDPEPGPDVSHVMGDGGAVYRRTGPLWQFDFGTGPQWSWAEIPSHLRVEASHPYAPDAPGQALLRSADGMRLAHPRRWVANGDGDSA